MKVDLRLLYDIIYADDILILSPSASQLEHLLHACESKLAWLDMAINFSKSCCIRDFVLVLDAINLVRILAVKRGVTFRG